MTDMRKIIDAAAAAGASASTAAIDAAVLNMFRDAYSAYVGTGADDLVVDARVHPASMLTVCTPRLPDGLAMPQLAMLVRMHGTADGAEQEFYAPARAPMQPKVAAALAYALISMPGPPGWREECSAAFVARAEQGGGEPGGES